MLYATMWEELFSDSRGDSRLATSPHLPLHHLLAILTSILLSYQVWQHMASVSFNSDDVKL